MSVIIQTKAAKRPLFQSLWRGWRGKCPNCAKGNMFHAYLKVNDTCPSCGEELFHHRADDAPPYVTIVIVGHILVGLMLHLEMAWSIPPYAYLFTLLPLAIVLPLWLLPHVKGTIVGLQWANRMHGFDPDFEED